MTGWTDRNGTEFRYEYDSAGRVVRTAGSGGFMSGAFAYDDANRATTYTDPSGTPWSTSTTTPTAWSGRQTR